jgi:hypothetical protein
MTSAEQEQKMAQEKDIVTALDKAETGIRRYLEIMALFPTVNVSTDATFQKKFNGFYRIRRNRVFRELYYSFMETHKNNAPSFTETVRYLGTYGWLEASFASKLLATINPNLPVWDKYVLRNTGLEAPAWCRNWETRVKRADTVYQTLIKWYADFVFGEEGKRWIHLFDERYPATPITPVKKIDFILWKLNRRP